jgi:hypothetical protein
MLAQQSAVAIADDDRVTAVDLDAHHRLSACRAAGKLSYLDLDGFIGQVERGGRVDTCVLTRDTRWGLVERAAGLVLRACPPGGPDAGIERHLGLEVVHRPTERGSGWLGDERRSLQ